MTGQALIPQDDWYAIIDMVTQSVDSPHSKRAYSRALIDFLDWYDQNGRPGFSKATVNAYREQLLREGKSRSSINQALSAIRKLAAEAADNDLVPPTLAYGVERVKGVKQEGVRAGNWLTKEAAEKLVNTPVYRWQREEIPVLKAIRDQAILAVMIGTRTDGNMTPQAIYNVVAEHVVAAGHYNRKGEPALAAHDLRRTALAAHDLRRRRPAANPADVGPRQHHDDGTVPGADSQSAGDGRGFHPD